MNSTAPRSGVPTRDTALLIAEPRPALRVGIELMSVLVSGATTSEMPSPNVMALADLVEKLGGAVVATHSQSGIMGHHMVRILKERGHLDLLKGLITIEGSCSLPNSGLKAEDFDNIPYLALKGDYTATSEVCQTTVDQINARRAAGHGTAKADYIKLDELGNPIFKGTTHMMMLGSNNLEVADVILNWADENIPPKNKNARNKK